MGLMRRSECATRQARGQSTAEVAVTIAFIVTAIVVMSIYVHRAYEGYLYAQSSSHGQQFDVTAAYTDTRSLNSFSTVQKITTTVDGMALETPEAGCNVGNPEVGGCAPSVTSSPTYGAILRSKVDNTTSWDVGRDATFTAN
jgi:hypothetical protein